MCEWTDLGIKCPQTACYAVGTMSDPDLRRTCRKHLDMTVDLLAAQEGGKGITITVRWI